MSSRKEAKVYIIDDDPVYVFGLHKLIQINKYSNSVLIFQNGLEAINRLKADMALAELLPDIILLDINMPVMDGWQFLEEFAAVENDLGKKATIYMVSSSIEETDKQRAQSIKQVKEYLSKPISVNALAEIFGVRNGASLQA